MKAAEQKVEVIIPTLAQHERRRELERAIQSVLAQDGVEARPVVILNGPFIAPEIKEWLESRHDIRCLHSRGKGVSAARLYGVLQVSAPFFATLDDDDELLPDALRTRFKAFDAETDVVVTGGYIDRDGSRLKTPDSRFFKSDSPIQAMQYGNWLSANGGMFRTESVRNGFFQDLPDILEWTYLACKLSLKLNVRLIEKYTYVTHVGSFKHASESTEYHLQSPDVIRRILELPLPKEVRRSFQRRLGRTLLNRSKLKRRSGDWPGSLLDFIRFLCLPGRTGNITLRNTH